MNGDDDAIGGDVLSPELRASFDALHAAMRTQRRWARDANEPYEVSAFNGVGLKRKFSSVSSDDKVVMPSFTNKSGAECNSSVDNTERRKFEAALAATLAADAEISHLSNGIAELEALLLQQGDGTYASNNIEFPTLPAIVPDESAVLECEGACGSHKDVGTPPDWKEELNAPQCHWS